MQSTKTHFVVLSIAIVSTTGNPRFAQTKMKLKSLPAKTMTIGAQFTFVAAYSGMRPKEILRLTGKEYSSSEGYINKEDHKTVKKGGSGLRAVFDVIAPVLDCRKAQYGDGLLFPSSTGKPFTATNYNQWFKKMIKKYHLRETILPYGLRHQFCVSCKRKGLSRHECARLMGHTDSHMVDMVYGHDAELFKETRDKANLLFAAALA